MAKKVIILLMILCLVCFCACGGPSKEPVIPTPDGIACNNEVFADLNANHIIEIYCSLVNPGKELRRQDISYEFIKYLKEATFYETEADDTEIYGGTWFEITFLNGTTDYLSFRGQCFTYKGHTYTGFSDDLLQNLRALFND